MLHLRCTWALDRLARLGRSELPICLALNAEMIMPNGRCIRRVSNVALVHNLILVRCFLIGLFNGGGGCICHFRWESADLGLASFLLGLAHLLVTGGADAFVVVNQVLRVVIKGGNS